MLLERPLEKCSDEWRDIVEALSLRRCFQLFSHLRGDTEADLGIFAVPIHPTPLE